MIGFVVWSMASSENILRFYRFYCGSHRRKPISIHTSNNNKDNAQSYQSPFFVRYESRFVWCAQCPISNIDWQQKCWKINMWSSYLDLFLKNIKIENSQTIRVEFPLAATAQQRNRKLEKKNIDFGFFWVY